MRALATIAAWILIWILAASCVSTNKQAENQNYDNKVKGRTAQFR